MKNLHDSGETLDRLLELVVLLDEDVTTSLARDGLTVPRATLVWLVHHHGASTQRALADAMSVTPRTVTGLVDGLEATGFVTREPHPTDRRATRVSLTEHAAGTVQAMARGHRELARQLFGDLTPAQLAAFDGGLQHVTGRVREALRAQEEESP